MLREAVSLLPPRGSQSLASLAEGKVERAEASLGFSKVHSLEPLIVLILGSKRKSAVGAGQGEEGRCNKNVKGAVKALRERGQP